jgi:hypothetical protein
MTGARREDRLEHQQQRLDRLEVQGERVGPAGERHRRARARLEVPAPRPAVPGGEAGLDVPGLGPACVGEEEDLAVAVAVVDEAHVLVGRRDLTSGSMPSRAIVATAHRRSSRRAPSGRAPRV